MARRVQTVLFLLCALLSATGVARAQAGSDGTFVFMSADTACSGTTAVVNCFLTNPDAAAKAVARLKDAGVRNFLIPSATLEEMRVIGRAVSNAGLKFYTYEAWEWQAAILPEPTGNSTFSCQLYTRERIEAEVLPLRNEFPNAYAGLHYQDEPQPRQIANLGALTDCVRADARLAGMKIFVDLLPMYSNQLAQATPMPSPGAMSPSQYGVDCALNGVVNPTLAAQAVSNFGQYVRNAVDTIRPDFLATNIYVFDDKLNGCPAGQELMMTEGLNTLSVLARSRGSTPVAYLQNVRTLAAPYVFYPTSFHHHRWYASWFFVFGGRDFANFVSHDDSTIAGRYHLGMLSPASDSRDLAIDALSTHGMTRQVQTQLAPYAYTGFVAPFLGVNTGQLVGWLPSDRIVAGEYGRNTDAKAMVYFARRRVDQTATVTMSLSKWWVRVEKLNFGTGGWDTVGSNTNTIDVGLTEFPGALYRLSMQ